MAAVVADIDDAIGGGRGRFYFSLGNVAPEDIAAGRVQGIESTSVQGIDNTVNYSQRETQTEIRLEVGKRVSAGRVQRVHFVTRVDIHSAPANYRRGVEPVQCAAPELLSANGVEGIEALITPIRSVLLAAGAEVQDAFGFYRIAVHGSTDGKAPELFPGGGVEGVEAPVTCANVCDPLCHRRCGEG